MDTKRNTKVSLEKLLYGSSNVYVAEVSKATGLYVNGSDDTRTELNIEAETWACRKLDVFLHVCPGYVFVLLKTYFDLTEQFAT